MIKFSAYVDDSAVQCSANPERSVLSTRTSHDRIIMDKGPVGNMAWYVGMGILK